MKKFADLKVIAEWDEDGNYWEYDEGVPYGVLHSGITPEQALEVWVDDDV